MIYYLLQVIKEIRNYLFLRKRVKESISSQSWEALNLRFDWLTGRIYTIVNLPLDFPNLPDLTRKAYIIEEVKAINAYLAYLNLHEIVETDEPKKVDDFNYLLVYKPLFRYFTSEWLTWFLIKTFGTLFIILYLHIKWDLFNILYNYIKFLF